MSERAPSPLPAGPPPRIAPAAERAAPPAAERKKTRRERLREELLNAPNLVTLARLACVPACAWLLAHESRRNCFFAAAIFAAAAIGDVLDGYLARISNSITTLGKFLDPLADKLIVLSALVMLLELGRVPVWVIVLILTRELLISGIRTLAVSEGLVISASQGGKWKTSLQLTGIICLMVHYHFAVDYLVGPPLLTDFHAVGMVLIYVSLVPSIVSAVDYVRDFYMLDNAGQGRG
jgi:CDP-diacylglycerol--glycerol-3-phosphate 3-phosphatidyltransferase